MSEGRKDDQSKIRMDLLPGDALEEIAHILTLGAARYGDRNWEKGMAWHRVFGATMRHLWAWWQGEHCDRETGRSHLAHAGCCILFLIAYEKREVGEDDRPLQPRPDVSGDRHGFRRPSEHDSPLAAQPFPGSSLSKSNVYVTGE